MSTTRMRDTRRVRSGRGCGTRAQQVAAAHDAEQPVVVVDDGEEAQALADHDVGDLGHRMPSPRTWTTSRVMACADGLRGWGAAAGQRVGHEVGLAEDAARRASSPSTTGRAVNRCSCRTPIAAATSNASHASLDVLPRSSSRRRRWVPTGPRCSRRPARSVAARGRRARRKSRPPGPPERARVSSRSARVTTPARTPRSTIGIARSSPYSRMRCAMIVIGASGAIVSGIARHHVGHRRGRAPSAAESVSARRRSKVVTMPTRR